MKKAVIFLSLIATFMACTSSDSSTTGTDKKADEPVAAAAPAEDPEVARGLELIGKSDCLSCHKIIDAGIGPAYEAVAAKYPDNDAVIDSLAGKIIKGGSGNWGPVAMTPHPQLSEADAKSMVKYVLSLK
jgi:cytochrome c